MLNTPSDKNSLQKSIMKLGFVLVAPRGNRSILKGTQEVKSTFRNKLTRFFLLIALILSGFVGASLAKASEFQPSLDEKKPNIMIWVADDQYLASVGCYGGDARHTPNIDRFAEQGMRFTRAYSTSSICTPSRSALYTGMYPIRNGAHPNHSGLKKDLPSMPSILRQHGYRCALVGKAGVHDRPTRPSNTFVWDREIDHTEEIIAGAESDEKASGKHRVMNYGAAMDFITESEQPFLLFVASSLPHSPGLTRIENGLEDYAANNWTADAQFGRFLAMLQESGKESHTLVIYVSDNGSNTDRSKYTLYEPGVNVPMIVRWPEHVPPGSVCDQLVDFTDVMPTLLEIVGASHETQVLSAETMDGKSLLPLLGNLNSPLRQDLFLSFTGLGVHDIVEPYPIRAIVQQRYKLIHNLNYQVTPHKGRGVKKSPEFELYDLLNDPEELNNLALSEANAQRVESMRARLQEWSRNVGDKGMETEYEAVAMFPELKELNLP